MAKLWMLYINVLNYVQVHAYSIHLFISEVANLFSFASPSLDGKGYRKQLLSTITKKLIVGLWAGLITLEFYQGSHITTITR